MKLRSRITICVLGVVVMALAGSGLALYTAWETYRLLLGITTINLPSVRAAEEVEIALLEQQAAVARFLLSDGDVAQLSDLDRTRSAFDAWLGRARLLAHTEDEYATLQKLEDVYRRYDRARATSVNAYDDGNPEGARALLREMTTLYQDAFRLCEQHIAANEQAVLDAVGASDRQMKVVGWIVGIAAGLTIVMATALLWYFFAGVVRPLRRLLSEANSQIVLEADDAAVDGELQAVGAYLRRALLEMKDSKTALEESRSQLFLTERLASVGKLAAGVAHEIRNPLTAIKMWLFSAREALPAGTRENEHLERIDKEVRRLESIVRNVLEFARPAPPRMQRCALNRVLNDSLDLAHPLIAERDVRVVGPQGRTDATLQADAAQLIQVFSNLFYNAVQAMPMNGTLTVTIDADPESSRTVLVRIGDTGSGISAEHQTRLFEPFFSTRDEGTGLGLCIAASIVAQHHGRIELESTGPAGSVFAVRLPLEPT